MSGHTPGPWTSTIREQKSSCCGEVQSSIGYISADTGHKEVAVLYSDCKEQAANARLIAAAPDLLAALHLAADALDAYSDVNDGQDGPTPNRAMAALQEIEAVLLKAEGTPR